MAKNDSAAFRRHCLHAGCWRSAIRYGEESDSCSITL
jgi:hypothetical protein